MGARRGAVFVGRPQRPIVGQFGRSGLGSKDCYCFDRVGAVPIDCWAVAKFFPNVVIFLLVIPTSCGFLTLGETTKGGDPVSRKIVERRVGTTMEAYV